MILRSYQQEALDALYAFIAKEKGENPCIVLPTGCHEAGHPILMYDGSVKAVENVAVGDLLMGPDSTPRMVLKKITGFGEMFKVTPVKGRPFIVNDEHILSLISTNEGKPHNCSTTGKEIVNISVVDYLNKAKYWKHLFKLRKTGVDFIANDFLWMPPYVLGLYLGDGHLKNGRISKPDVEIRNDLQVFANQIGLEFKMLPQKKHCPVLRIIGVKGCKNQILEYFKDVGLIDKKSGDKFIPKQYLITSRFNRLEMLAGLLDTDGHMTKAGFDYITKSEIMAKQIEFLCRSLGLSANVTPCFKKCQTGVGGIYYRISITGNCDSIPCRIKRKQSPKRRQKKDHLKTGFKIESVGSGHYYGFTLDKDHLYVDGNFFIHHNSGKSLIISKIAKDCIHWGRRVLIVAHVKELLEQTIHTIHRIDPNLTLEVGINSAGLGSRDTDAKILVAGIQSVFRSPEKLGHRDICLVDEVHRIPETGEGMYRNLIAGLERINPAMRVAGFTATPYRLDGGWICKPDNILNKICYEIGVKELIAQGYLAPLVSKAPKDELDLKGLRIVNGEFEAGATEELYMEDHHVVNAVAEIVHYGKDRKKGLVFAAGIKHAEKVCRILNFNDEKAECVFGNTSSNRRDELVKAFREGEFKYLVNVGVFTTGFDVPDVDLIALLKPTMSAGLFVQMLGRGMRIAQGKKNCLILDYGQNVARHGPIDCIQIQEKKKGKKKGESPAKTCVKCLSIVHAAYTVCPDCGNPFPAKEVLHDERASSDSIMRTEDQVIEFDVKSVEYMIHVKRNADSDTPRTLRVKYMVSSITDFNEWICFEHVGYARTKAERWWRERMESEFAPLNVDDALEMIQSANNLNEPRKIKVLYRVGSRFPEIAWAGDFWKPHSEAANTDVIF